MDTPLKKSITAIKTQHIQPDAKWKYLLKKYSLWFSFGLLSLCAAICAAVAYHLASELDWDLYRFQDQTFLHFLLTIAPWAWLLPFVGMLIISFWNIRKTESGYRFRFGTIVIISFGISFSLASALAAFGYGRIVNNALINRFPVYQHSITTKETQWSQPEKGFLAGTIESAMSNSLELTDLQGKQWRVNLTDQTIIRPTASIENGNMIKTIGQQTDDKHFSAKEIRPWEGRGKNMNQHEKQHNSQRHQYKESCGKK